MGWLSGGKGKKGSNESNNNNWSGGNNNCANGGGSANSANSSNNNCSGYAGGVSGGYLAVALTKERERASALEQLPEKADTKVQEKQAEIWLKAIVGEALRDSLGLGKKQRNKADGNKTLFFNAIHKMFHKKA